MNELSFTIVKATLSKVVDDARNGRPTVITRHGKQEAVVVSVEDWNKATAKPSLWEMLTNAPIDGRELALDRKPMRKLDL